jgi:phage tail sheath protein FI
MALDVGINVVEVDGKSSPTIQGAPTSVAAFIGVTERGVPNLPVRLATLDQFRSRFGANRADAYLAYAIEGFFLNGGVEAYVNRVVGAGSVPASATLSNRESAPAGPALRVFAGYRGRQDPGAWGERIRCDVTDDPRGRTSLQASTVANATSAQLVSLNGIQVGSVVQFVDGLNVFFRKVTALDATTRTISWTDLIAPVLNQASTIVTTAEFRLTVRYQASPTAEFTVVEDWRNLSMETDSTDYAADSINHPFTGSRYITVADLSGAALSGEQNPVVISNVALAGAVENDPVSTDYLGSAAGKTGYHALDTLAVQLVAASDVHQLSPADRDIAVHGALDYCAVRGDCMFVGATPDRGAPVGVTPRAISDYTELESDYLNTMQNFSANFQANKVFGALYGPWIRVSDPIAAGLAPARFIPPDGHVLGLYARTERERGIWKAPAGIAAQVLGALDIAATFTDAEHTDLVRNGRVNGIRRLPGAGITVAASRTLSTDTRWWFVNVRLLFNFVKSSLRDGLRFVRQEPHTETLRRMVRFNVITPFLLGLWRQGAFGTDAPELVFTVKCDAENNPPDQVDLGNFKVEVYFYPVKPAESVVLIVGQQPSGATASES